MPPFTTRDARRHKKGLSARQARQWSHVANSMYNRCISSGVAAATCEARAIRGANGVTGTPAQSTNERRFTIETALTVPPSRLTLNDREYLTAPAVLIVEGVLNGGYIAGAELMPQDWNAVPVVVNHPVDADQQPQSARSPEVLAQCGIGHLYRCRLGEGQRRGHPAASLCAEIWIDVAQAQACGGEALEVMAMLETQTPIEVSTGFYSDAVRQAGSFYGTPYQEILVNLRPDHLAILPNTLGACSWADGCGLPRLHEDASACTCETETCTCHLQTEEEVETEEAIAPARGWRGFLRLLRTFVAQEEAAPPAAADQGDAPPPEDDDEDDPADEVEDATAAEVLMVEQTDVDLREALYGCLAREMGTHSTPIFIESVDHENHSFVYRQGERLCRRYWHMEEGLVVLAEDHEDVQRNTSYTAVPGSSGPVDEQEEYVMTVQNGTKAVSPAIKARVNALINNERTGWNEGDRHHLETMSEAALIRLGQETIEREPPPPAAQPGSLEEAVALHIPQDFGMRETITSAVRRYERHKSKLIDIVVNAKSNPFTREELASWDDTRLEQLVVMAGEPLPDQTPPHLADVPANYTGRHMPQIRIVNMEEDAVPPTPNTLDRVIERQRELGLRA